MIQTKTNVSVFVTKDGGLGLRRARRISSTGLCPSPSSFHCFCVILERFLKLFYGITVHKTDTQMQIRYLASSYKQNGVRGDGVTCVETSYRKYAALEIFSM